jgi:heme oxygenase (mycobilin-producing)
VPVIKINAITVPAEAGDELAKRFAARAGAVEGQDGFEGFELLEPSDDRRCGWWSPVGATRRPSRSGWEAPRSSTATLAPTGPPSNGGPVSVSSELWSYKVAGGSAGQG